MRQYSDRAAATGRVDVAAPDATPRVVFEFDGPLDEVGPEAASALAAATRPLLEHSDRHTGRPATIRIAQLSSMLNLWLDDPECTTACLVDSGGLPRTAAQHDCAAGEVRLFLTDHAGGGLRVHWALALPE